MKKQMKILMIFTLMFILVLVNTGRVAAQTMTIGPDNLGAEYTKQYNVQLGVMGGIEPYTFTIVDGSLPNNFTLSPSGQISGFAEGDGATPGIYPVTIKATDGTGETATRGYDFVVDKGTPTMTAWAPKPGYWSRPFNLRADVMMETGLGNYYPLPGTVAFSIDGEPVSECQAVLITDFYYFCEGITSLQPSVGSHTVKAVYTPALNVVDYYYPAEASVGFNMDPIYVSIWGDVFRDQNQDGLYDENEYSVGGGWSVYLDQDCDGSIDNTVLTGNYFGYYRFDEVAAGHWYCISTEERPGYQHTTDLPKIWLINSVYDAHIGYYYPTIILNPYQLPPVQLGNSIYQEFTASGGAEPYTYRISWGTLPDELTFTEAGVLSGTPAATGSTVIKIEVEDANHAVSDNYYQILVKTDGVFTFTSSSNPSTFGDPVTFTVSASGNATDPNLGTIPPIGSVTFYVDGVQNEECPYLSLNQGESGIGDYPVGCVMSTLEPGSHQITANFWPFSDVYNIPTLTLTQTVQAGNTSNLHLTNVVSKTQVKPEAKLVYTLTVSNVGPDAAENLSLIDWLDYNTTFVSLNAPKGWTCGYADGVVTCTSSKLDKGKTATVIITATVNKTAPIGQEVFNNTNLSCKNYDPNLANNYAYQQSVVRE